MGLPIYIQLSAARSYDEGKTWRNFVPLINIHKSFSQRRIFGGNNSVKAVSPTQARRAGTLSKSNFAEPKWLLPAKDSASESVAEKKPDEPFYQVVLTTSSGYGSGISDLSSGILLAFIGEEGRCFIHRVPTQVFTKAVETSEQIQTVNKPCYYRFQRGSQDQVSFFGPELGQLKAVWVAPEKGTWNVKGMTVTVFPKQANKGVSDVIEDSHRILQYDFACEECLIGEKDDNLAAELIPSKVTEILTDSIHSVLESEVMIHGLQTPLNHQVRVKGIKEYETLKFSLLSYDAILVALGSVLTSATGHTEAAEGYLVGGFVGFLYLFVLEKTVDQLPAPSTFPLSETDKNDPTAQNSFESGVMRNSTEANEKGMSLAGSLNGFRGPLAKYSGILAAFLLILKYRNSANNQAISKEMLLAGVAGFLMTKLAALLAANLPVSAKQPSSFEEES